MNGPAPRGRVRRQLAVVAIMSELSTTLLAELMSRRRNCLEQLLALGLRQAELIAAGDMSELLRLIAAKQQLIVALQALEKRLAPFERQDPAERRWFAAEARARCAEDAAACRQLLAEVMALEQSGEREMSERRDAVASQVRTATTAGRVREAYLNQR